jgi:hypothetical protein
MSHRLSATELELMKELAAAGRRGRTVPTTSRSGLARMLAMRYVTERSISPDAVLYVITDRGRRVLADAAG